jgi:hypothetical protein
MASKWVVHCKRIAYSAKQDGHGYVYIGRPSKWGNPFAIGRDGTRDEVIAKYREYLDKNVVLKAQARKELRGMILGCWCAPMACHGDVLAEVANG